VQIEMHLNISEMAIHKRSAGRQDPHESVSTEAPETPSELATTRSSVRRSAFGALSETGQLQKRAPAARAAGPPARQRLPGRRWYTRWQEQPTTAMSE
jgi:hypothetical protein